MMPNYKATGTEEFTQVPHSKLKLQLKHGVREDGEQMQCWALLAGSVLQLMDLPVCSISRQS